MFVTVQICDDVIRQCDDVIRQCEADNLIRIYRCLRTAWKIAGSHHIRLVYIKGRSEREKSLDLRSVPRPLTPLQPILASRRIYVRIDLSRARRRSHLGIHVANHGPSSTITETVSSDSTFRFIAELL
eukprot:sb/3475345/